MSIQRLTVDDIPDLPGYLTVSGVAARYGVNKGTIYHMIYHSRRFSTVFKVAKGDEDKRPLLLLSQNEVEKVFRERNKEEVDDPGLTKKAAEWNKRVKQWGRDTGWTQTPIRVSGRPQLALEQAYLKEHPDDPRPGTP